MTTNTRTMTDAALRDLITDLVARGEEWEAWEIEQALDARIARRTRAQLRAHRKAEADRLRDRMTH